MRSCVGWCSIWGVMMVVVVCAVVAAVVAAFFLMGGTTSVRKSQAAVVAQNLLEAHPLVMMSDVVPAQLANRLVENAWGRRAHQFEAKGKPSPQKVSIAMIAFADGLGSLEARSDAWYAAFFALGHALDDIERSGGHGLNFNGSDVFLLSVAREAYLHHSAEVERRRELASPRASEGKLSANPRQPDMSFAAKSYAHIALMRMNNSNADFHAVLEARASSMRADGATEHQVLSALWGGHYGIDAELDMIRANAREYVDAFEKTKIATGSSHLNVEQGPSSFHMAATKHLALVMVDAPQEFERFLAHMETKAA